MPDSNQRKVISCHVNADVDDTSFRCNITSLEHFRWKKLCFHHSCFCFLFIYLFIHSSVINKFIHFCLCFLGNAFVVHFLSLLYCFGISFQIHVYSSQSLPKSAYYIHTTYGRWLPTFTVLLYLHILNLGYKYILKYRPMYSVFGLCLIKNYINIETKCLGNEI